MTLPTTAEIISFPVRQPAPERLTAALTALSTALSEQQKSIQRWHQALNTLAAEMRALSGHPTTGTPVA